MHFLLFLSLPRSLFCFLWSVKWEGASCLLLATNCTRDAVLEWSNIIMINVLLTEEYQLKLNYRRDEKGEKSFQSSLSLSWSSPKTRSDSGDNLMVNNFFVFFFLLLPLPSSLSEKSCNPCYTSWSHWTSTTKSDPPSAPVLKVTSTSTSTINLSWTVKSSEDNFLPITGYILHHRKHDSSTNSGSESGGGSNGVRLNQIQSAQHLRTPSHHHPLLGSNSQPNPIQRFDWDEIRLSGDHSTHSFDHLACGSRYQFYVIAINTIGQSDPSEILIAKTDGSQPVAPDKFALLSVNSTAVNVFLSAWHDGNCPMATFELLYKPRKPLPGSSRPVWESFGLFPASTKSVAIRDLIPSTIYDLKITATNEAGSTEAQYSLATPGITDESLAATLPSSLNLLEMTVSLILPTTISLVLLIILVLSTRIWIIRKRHSTQNHGQSFGT